MPGALVNVNDYELEAARRLPQPVLDYYAGGALDEVTLRENRAAYERIPLYFRVLAGIRERSLDTTVLGERVSMPILVAPTAFHRMAHDEGEMATARAAAQAGTLMVVSTLSNTNIEDISAASDGPLWFQLYIYKDREATRDLIARVEKTRCSAIMLTVDAPLLGPRERDVRNRFTLPEGLSVKNLLGAGQGIVGKEAGGSGLASYVTSFLDPAISWKDVEWLQSITKLPLLIKGIVRADDAKRAASMGVQGIVVSNHGGRQLDTSPATIDALPHVVHAAGGRAEVYVDGGVRRGVDVVKALALGARAVFVGRPILWGLAVDGERGVARVLDLLRNELDNAMGLCGVSTVAEVDGSLLRPE
jgi:4-hydroxymandelate oxidase